MTVITILLQPKVTACGLTHIDFFIPDEWIFFSLKHFSLLTCGQILGCFFNCYLGGGGRGGKILKFASEKNRAVSRRF